MRTVQRGLIARMRCTAMPPSGTVLWSVSLPVSREAVVTDSGLAQGGGVLHGLRLRRDATGYAARAPFRGPEDAR